MLQRRVKELYSSIIGSCAAGRGEYLLESCSGQVSKAQWYIVAQWEKSIKRLIT